MSYPGAMTTGMQTGVVPPPPPAYAPYGRVSGQPAPPQTPGPPAPPAPKPPRARGLLVALIAATALISAGIGGGIVAVFNHTTAQPAQTAPPAPTDAQVHADNVHLCTLFATYNSAMTNSPNRTADQIMPQVFGLRLALAQSPNAG